MKQSRLLALGALGTSLLLPIAAPAQTSQKAPNEPKRSHQIRIEHHIEKEDGESPEDSVIVVDIPEFDVDVDVDFAKDFDFDFDQDMDSDQDMDDDVDADYTPVFDSDSLRATIEKHISAVRQKNALRREEIDSLRAAIRERLVTTREMSKDMRRLEKDINRKLRAAGRLRVIVRQDTVGMAKELEAAQASIDEATRSLDAIHYRSPAASSYMDLLKSGEIYGNISISDSTDQDGNHMMVLLQRNKGGADGKGCRTIVGGALGNNIVFKAYGDSANGASVIYRTYITDSTLASTPMPPMPPMPPAYRAMPPLPPLPPLPPMPPLWTDGKGEVVLIDTDSIHVVDGKDAQTVIRIVRDTTIGNSHSRTVIIMTSRGTPCTKQTEGAIPPPATEAPMLKQGSAPEDDASAGYLLEANRPNPFSGSTTISFTLPRPEHATLTIYDAHGTLVKTLEDGDMGAGTHTSVFDASGLPSGTYLYRLMAGSFIETKTMTLEK